MICTAYPAGNAGGQDWPLYKAEAMDKRREWAAVAAAQIVNLHWSIDAPKHVLYFEIEKVILAALHMAAAEQRRTCSRHRRTEAMTVKQAAARLEVSQATVYALVAAGRRSFQGRPGRGTIRITEDHIADYITQAEPWPTFPPPPARHVRSGTSRSAPSLPGRRSHVFRVLLHVAVDLADHDPVLCPSRCASVTVSRPFFSPSVAYPFRNAPRWYSRRAFPSGGRRRNSSNPCPGLALGVAQEQRHSVAVRTVRL